MTSQTPRRARFQRAPLTALILFALVAFGAGCGSDSGKSNGADSAPSTTAANGASAVGSDEISAAEAEVKAARAAPTEISVTTELKAAPAAGKTFVYLDCGAGSCPYVGDQVKAAATAAGWKYQKLSFDISNPANLVSAMESALQYKPVAVTFAGLPEAVWSSIVPKYKDAGVILIPLAVGPVTISQTVPFNADSPDEEAAMGKLAGNWFIADSKAKGKALLVDFPDIPVLTANAESMASTIKSGCASCSTETIKATIAQVQGNGVVPAVVSALQRDRSINYVLSSQAQFMDGLSSALEAAGLSGIKVAGSHPSTKNLSDLSTGTTSAFVGNPLAYMSWLAVDAALRHDQGMEAGPGTLPLQVLDKTNVGTLTDTSFSNEVPKDFADQFKKLWKV